MSVYQSSLLGEEGDDERAAADFQRVSDVMVDPALEMCLAASEEKMRVRPKWDGSVFVLNCLTYLQVRYIPDVYIKIQNANFPIYSECVRTILVHA